MEIEPSLKQFALENVVAVGVVAVAAYILYTGIRFGRWPAQGFTKEEKPILYWVYIAIYAFYFAGAIYVLIDVVKLDITAANWPTSPKNPN